MGDYSHDGDGARVMSVMGGVTTKFVGNHWEWTSASVKKYYYASGQRIAMRTGAAQPQWLIGDHLGSTSKVANFDGTLNSSQLYMPWGELRYPTTSALPTKFQYTGQYSYAADFGLHYYNARWYDPYLNRWAQPDSIVPLAEQGVQAFDRYAYSNNNPLRYVDPSGHSASSPPPSTDDCGPDGIYCNDDANINWDPETDPGLSKKDKALAEQAYLLALEDPGYFLDLYFNTDTSLWNSDEVAYLNIYLQYSDLHMTAEEFILAGWDIQAARAARAFYNAGDKEMGNIHLQDAIAPIGAVIPLGLGSTGRTKALNLREQVAMDKLLENPLKYGKHLRMRVDDIRWPWESGWQKWSAKIDNVEIHWLYNPLTAEYDDFKYAK